MTLLSAIIQQAYREANLIAIGASCTSAEETEALKRLQVILASVIGNEAGQKLSEFPIGENNVTEPEGWVPDVPDYMPINTRAVCNLEAAQTLYLHPAPQDGSRFAVVDASGNFNTYNLTLNGNGRKVAGSSTAVLSTASLSREYFYRADLGDWKVVSTLTAADEMPFPVEFDDMFVIFLAMRILPRNAQSIPKEATEMAARSLNQFRARYRQNVPLRADPALQELRTTNAYNINRDGWPWPRFL